jgi:hypothetical protein
MPTCPLTQRETEVAVRTVSTGFAVDVQSSDEAAAKNIWRRARALATRER